MIRVIAQCQVFSFCLCPFLNELTRNNNNNNNMCNVSLPFGLTVLKCSATNGRFEHCQIISFHVTKLHLVSGKMK